MRTKRCGTKFQKEDKRILKLEEKILALKLDKKERNGEIKRLRKRARWFEESRDNWKVKAMTKGLENKALSRKLRRQEKASRHQYSMGAVELCQKLRLDAGCSYRSIPKILTILNICLNLGLTRIPCANTVQNWVSKMGLYWLVNAGKDLLDKEVCLIVDECAGVGREKLLVILACPAKKEGDKALSFADVQVCYIGERGSWNGEGVAEKLKLVADTYGFDVNYVLSDQASVLPCAVRKFGVPHVPDIGHAMGTCLRKTFEKETDFVKFTKLVSSYQAKLVNQKLAFLRPPKQRTKARFMNMKPMTTWANTMLAKFGELGEKGQEFFKELGEHKPIINSLGKCILIAEEIGLELRKKGLSRKTIRSANAVVTKYKKEEGLVKLFVGYVKKYLADYEELTKEHEGALQVSSDIIESMFGKYKHIRGSNPLVSLSALCLELPTYSVKAEDFSITAKDALEDVFMSNLDEWIKTQSSGKQALERQLFFKKSA